MKNRRKHGVNGVAIGEIMAASSGKAAGVAYGVSNGHHRGAGAIAKLARWQTKSGDVVRSAKMKENNNEIAKMKAA